jgi:hypothetical protein
MDTALLVDRHLELFQVIVIHTLFEDADKKVMGELILLREAVGGYGVKAGEECFVYFVALVDGREGVVGEFVIKAKVAEGGGTFGEIAEIGLILFLKESVLSGKTLRDGLGILGDDGGREGDQQADAPRESHKHWRVPERNRVCEKKAEGEARLIEFSLLRARVNFARRNYV